MNRTPEAKRKCEIVIKIVFVWEVVPSKTSSSNQVNCGIYAAINSSKCCLQIENCAPACT